MPYFTDGLTSEQIKQIRFKNVCAVCGGTLFEYLDKVTKRTYLSCGNTEHKGIKKEGLMDSKSLMVMTEQDMERRISVAKFPQELTAVDKKILNIAARTYGFDPLMGEISIYQGRPYVNIDGRYRKAQETGNLDGVETRPATEDEKLTWQIPEGDYFFRSEVSVKGASKPFVGWGRVFLSETTGGKGFKPVEKNPQRMAEKRAEAQALRKSFHIPLPSYEEIGSPEDLPVNLEIKEIKPEQIIDPQYDEEIIKPERPARDPSESKLPEFKNVADVFNYALKHGFTMAKIKELIGTDNPTEVKTGVQGVVNFLGLK